MRLCLLLLAGLFYALHLVHLSADFPANTPWVDWARYTDEGWYSDAAIRRTLFGHWFLPGDFNPAVALPIWPLLETCVFRFTGVSLVAARALAVGVFGITLLAVYGLIRRSETLSRSSEALGESSEVLSRSSESLAAPLAVFLLAVSPFLFAFERLAILEPLLGTLTVLALLCALYLPVPRNPHAPRQVFWPVFRRSLWRFWPSLALGILLPAMVLTKPTAIALLPAILCAIWGRAHFRLLPAIRLAALPLTAGLALWAGYYFGFVRPHFAEDFSYFFGANDYTGFQSEPLAGVLFHTVADGLWIGPGLYLLFFALTAVLVALRPHFFRNPLVPALLLWIVGYFAFLAYHNNLQARYYLLLALPVTMFVPLALEELRGGRGTQKWRVAGAPFRRWGPLAVAVLAIAVPDALQQIGFLAHPTYTYLHAAEAIAYRIRQEREHSPLVLSVSGSDLTLMTGLPSINTEFGTLDLDQRVRQYRPGWYLAWNQVNDEDMKDIAPFARPVLVGMYPAMDDPDRNLLLLYRLDPLQAPSPIQSP